MSATQPPCRTRSGDPGPVNESAPAGEAGARGSLGKAAEPARGERPHHTDLREVMRGTTGGTPDRQHEPDEPNILGTLRTLRGGLNDALGDDTYLRHVDMSGLATAELPPPKFVIEPLIPRGYLTLFGGHGGSGKTSVALVIGAHIACGRNWAGLDVRRGRVLFVSFEDREQLVLWRLRNIAYEYALHLPDIQSGMTVIDATEAAAIVYEASDAGVRRVIPSRDGEELCSLIQSEQYDLAIIDNASDAFDGDENSRRQVKVFIRYLTRAVKAHDGAVLLLAHIDKTAAKYGSARNSYSGSTGWHNTARSRLALVDDELRQEKLNVGKALPVPISLTFSPLGVPVVAAISGATAAQDSDDAEILACFRAAAEAGQTINTASAGTATTWHGLSVDPEMTEQLKANKTRVREGVARLLRGGLIRAEEYTNGDRKTKERFVLAPVPPCASSRQFRTGAELEHPHNPLRQSCARGVGGSGADNPEGLELAQPYDIGGFVECDHAPADHGEVF